MRIGRMCGFAAVVALLLSGWWLGPCREERVRGLDGSQDDAQDSELSAHSDTLSTPTAASSHSERKEASAGSSPPVSLIVLDDDGGRVADAEVTVTGVAAVDDWHRLSATGRATASPHFFSGKTGADGALVLPDRAHLPNEDRYILWVTHRNRLGTWIDFTAIGDDREAQIEVQLQARAELQAEVLQTDGSRATGGWVVQTVMGVESPLEPMPGYSETPDQEELARRSFVRRVPVSGSGTAQLFPLRYECYAQAVQGDLLSECRIVAPTRTALRLELQSCFYLRGTCTCTDTRGPGGRLYVLTTNAHVQDIASWYVVGSDFGPLHIPLPSNARLVAVLDSECGATAPVDLTDVRAGETRTVHFDATPTSPSWVRVVDEAGNPIRGATVTSSWLIAGNWVRKSATSDAEGYCAIVGIGSDSILVSARHTLFASVAGIDCLAHQPKDSAPIISLSSARDISGHVFVSGKPAGAFTVFAWSEDPQASQSFSFRDRERGDFELPRVSTEELHLLAAGPGMSSSAIVTVPAGDAPVNGVRLDCLAASRLQLQAFDSSTGDPIQGAVVSQSPYAMQVGLPSVSPELVTDSQGFASFADFSCSETVVFVEHEDYSSRSLVLPAVSPDSDRGAIRVALDGMKRVTVTLLPWPPVEWKIAWVRITGSSESDYEEVDSSGSRSFDSVAVGPLDVYVVFPDSTTISWEGYIFPGPDETIEIDLETDNQLEVSLAGHRDEVGERLICEYVSVRGEAPAFSLRTLMDDAGTARLSGLPQREGLIRISLEGGTEIAEKVITQEILAAGQVSLEASTHHIELAVSESDGAPASGVYVYAAPDNAPFQLYDWAMTNADGEASIARSGDTPSSVLAALGAKVTSVRRFDPMIYDEDVMTLTFIEPVEVRFAAPGAGSAFVEVQCHVNVEQPRLWIAEVSTSVPMMISPGTYSLVLKTPGLWLDEDTIRIPEAGGVVEIQVRRLGVLSISALVADGVALAELEVVDGLSGESSVDRLARGAISRVEVEGGFEFRGLPCGEYRWSARFVDGLERSGTVQVAPDTRTSLEIARD